MKQVFGTLVSIHLAASGSPEPDALTDRISADSEVVALNCFDPQLADAGYVVTFFKRGSKLTRATLEELSFIGTKRLATYSDSYRITYDARTTDQPEVEIVFHDPQLRDAGYTLGLTSKDLDGRQFVEIGEIRIWGARSLARLACFRPDPR